MIHHGEPVKLAPIDREHLPMLRRWRNDYRIWATCRQNDLITDVAQEDWYARVQRDGSTRMYLVMASEPVGVAGLTSIDWPNRRAEFSLYIAPEHQRKGYARAALKTLLAHAFQTLGLNCVWGESFEGNPAMVLFESVGMKREGVRREFYFRGGRFLDAHLYSILRSEWDSRLRDRDTDAPVVGVALNGALVRVRGFASVPASHVSGGYASLD